MSNGQEDPHFKEVGFPACPSPKPRAQTLATTSVLREPRDYTVVDTRSNEPARTELPLDFATYIEQSRAALESQRTSFERERAAFAHERKLWDRERSILKSRIAQLEGAPRNSGGRMTQRRDPDLPSWAVTRKLSGCTDRLNGTTNGHHVWEGPSQARKPTRVFPDERQKQDTTHHRNEGNGGRNWGSFNESPSPKSHAPGQRPHIAVPIEKIDSTLDGITLKSSGLPPEVLARVISESPESNNGSSPQKPSSGQKQNRRISLVNLGPPEDNLTKDAGHTPMAIIEPCSDIDDEENEAPLAPQTTICRPRERSDSYFSEPDDDPALKGPLGLKNEKKEDDPFLSALNQRLLNEAKRAVSRPSVSGTTEDDDDEGPEQDEPEPELRFRKTSNFGSAFGSTKAF
ncbi:hypothetical protein FQN54_001683 [Arachnomyces sp. PD_36]|nr:hypothetical protein FQN54_001683 [Arachnomyces sp. PD_36]